MPRLFQWSNIVQQGGEASPPSIIFFCKDPDSKSEPDCETFYRTDRDSWLIQLKKMGIGVEDQLVGLGADETYGEMSARTVDLFVRMYVKELYGVDLPDRTGQGAR